MKQYRVPNIVAAVAIVDQHARLEVCEIEARKNVYPMLFGNVILRYDSERKEILAEIKRYVDDEVKSAIVRFTPSNGWLTVYDSDFRPVLYLMPCETYNKAIREAKTRAIEIQSVRIPSPKPFAQVA